MGQRQSEIIKNHMEVYWHDYASASKIGRASCRERV